MKARDARSIREDAELSRQNHLQSYVKSFQEDQASVPDVNDMFSVIFHATGTAKSSSSSSSSLIPGGDDKNKNNNNNNTGEPTLATLTTTTTTTTTTLVKTQPASPPPPPPPVTTTVIRSTTRKKRRQMPGEAEDIVTALLFSDIRQIINDERRAILNAERDGEIRRYYERVRKEGLSRLFV
jgi:hypothetical protein